jgi:holo-[acyl-carrier protein] synthase
VIIGLGSDLCNIERIQASLDRFGARFEKRVFTEAEQAKGNRRPFTKAGTLAKRWLCKSSPPGLEVRHSKKAPLPACVK